MTNASERRKRALEFDLLRPVDEPPQTTIQNSSPASDLRTPLVPLRVASDALSEL